MKDYIVKLSLFALIVALLAVAGLQLTTIKYRYTVRENITYGDNTIKFDLYCKTEYKYGANSKRYLDTFSFKVDNPTSMRNVFTDRQCKTTSNLYNE